MEGGYSNYERARPELQKEAVRVREDFLSPHRVINGLTSDALIERLYDVAAEEGLEQFEEYLVSGRGYWYEARGTKSIRRESESIAAKPGIFSHFEISSDTPDDIDVWAVFELEQVRMPGQHKGYFNDRTHCLFVRAESLSCMGTNSFEQLFDDDDVPIGIEPAKRADYLSGVAAAYDELCSSKTYEKASPESRAALEFKLLHRANTESGIIHRSAVLMTPETRIYLPAINHADKPYQLVPSPEDPIGVTCIAVDGVDNRLLSEPTGMADKTLCIGVELDATNIGKKRRRLVAAYLPLLAQNVGLHF